MLGTVERQLSQEMQECIQKCLDCHNICLKTFNDCVRQGGELREDRCIRLLISCADMCRTTASFAFRGFQLYERVCLICAEVCELCVGELDRMPGDALKACAEICSQCAECCKQIPAAPETGTQSRQPRSDDQGDPALFEGGGGRTAFRSDYSSTLFKVIGGWISGPGLSRRVFVGAVREPPLRTSLP